VFVRPPDLSHVHPEALPDTKACYLGVIDVPLDSGRVLTDDFNPVEFYDAPNREAIRRRLAMAARKM
jgi:hypothetical protein